MDSDLLILLVLTVAAVWFLIDLLHYIDIRGQMSQTDREKHIFGKVLRPETRLFMLSTIATINSSKRFVVILVASLLIGVVAKFFGVIG